MYRMLIVDDEPAIVDGLTELFSECGMDLDVWKATSAEEALAIVRKMRVDVVLSDIRMPEKNGLQLIDEIIAYWPSCKVIFLTGYSEFEYAYAAFQKNVENYILKHEDDATLLAAVQAVVDKLDEVYPHVAGRAQLATSAGTLVLEQTGFTDAVVWNPGAVDAAALADLANDEYKRFVCIEPALLDPLTLEAGESWTGTYRIS